VTQTSDPDRQARREYAQLLRLQERYLLQIQRMVDELRAPGTLELLKEIRHRTGQSPEKQLQEVGKSLEEAMRSLKLSQAEMEQGLAEDPAEFEVEGVQNLPATLARFLAERQNMPGFHYEVLHDEIRGWVIAWKEYTSGGTVRGYGQFYERPYAWLDE
jgi:uncharacterized protein (DUF3084 family)